MLKALGSYPFTTPPNPNYQYHRPMSTPSGYHYPMYGEDYDHGIFDNDKFWNYENYEQFDPGNMLNGVGDVGCGCGEGCGCLCDATATTDSGMGAKHVGLLVAGVAVGFLISKFI